MGIYVQGSPGARIRNAHKRAMARPGSGPKTRAQKPGSRSPGPEARAQKLGSISSGPFKSLGPKARVQKPGFKSPGSKARVQKPGSKSPGPKARAQKPGSKSPGRKAWVQKPGSKNHQGCGGVWPAEHLQYPTTNACCMCTVAYLISIGLLHGAPRLVTGRMIKAPANVAS